MKTSLYLIASVIVLVSAGIAQELSERQLTKLEKRLDSAAEAAQSQKSDPPQVSGAGWVLRSKHLCFGLPKLADSRHDFDPDGEGARTGVSVVVREGFVVAHFDRMKAPLFVSQRWTKADYHRMKNEPKYPRPWKEDLELPEYARGGTSYDGTETGLDRGHMARHEGNRAWGEDSSDAGCFMSNSAPQHKDVNRGPAWRELEDAVRDVVTDESADIETIWVITGTLYRPKAGSPDATPESDFQGIQLIMEGFGVPHATYKVFGWFDRRGLFQARGYVFEQDEGSKPLSECVTKIDDIELRAGVDFFPELHDSIEALVESADHVQMWSDT